MRLLATIKRVATLTFVTAITKGRMLVEGQNVSDIVMNTTGTQTNVSSPINGNSSSTGVTSPTVPVPESESVAPTKSPTRLTSSQQLDGMQGALVTSDCLFDDGNYPYAIDIFWSCGDERFNEPLRLHTFKRHSRSHSMVFADQLISYRDDKRLWFDAYNIPRCIRINDDDELQVTSSREQCAQFDFLPSDFENWHKIQDATTGRCLGLGAGSSCSSDRSTGGNECGGVDHRYLPLVVMEDCNSGLVFQFQTEAQDCSNGRSERPENACF